jgi:hypothetical protein
MFPPEGLPVLPTIEKLAGPKIWAEYVKAQHEYRVAAEPEPGNLVRPDEVEAARRFERFKDLWLGCYKRFLAAWNTGELVASGRRGDPLAPSTLIPSPGTSWPFKIADLERSIIDDPGRAGAKIFDLRFCLRPAAPAGSAVPATGEATVEGSSSPAKRAMSPVEWLAYKVKEVKCTPNHPTQSTDIARLLAPKMVAAVKAGECSKVLAVGTIVNYLRDHKLWP